MRLGTTSLPREEEEEEEAEAKENREVFGRREKP